jgi:hypothetical protein
MLRITDIARLLKRDVGRESVIFSIAGSGAATAANYTVPLFPVGAASNHPMTVVAVNVRYTTASSSGTLNLVRCGAGVVVGSGTSVLANTIDLAQTAENVYAGTLATDFNARIVRPGDALYLVAAGTLTNLAGISVRIVLQNLRLNALTEQ